MNFSLPMDGEKDIAAEEAAGEVGVEVAAALGTACRQRIIRMHGTSHRIAPVMPRGAEASALAACNAAPALEGDTAGDVETARASEAAAHQAGKDAQESEVRSFSSSAVAVGRAEAEHSSAASGVEVARWGSSIPRMPAVLREGFLAEVKSLQKKPIMKITTSVEGAYGESSVSSLFKLFSLLNKHFGLNEHSTFLDIGSGSGVPSLAAAAFGCTFTLGLELDSNVYSISVINHLSLVDLLLLQQLYLGVQLNWHHTEEFIDAALSDLCQPIAVSAPGATPRATDHGLVQRGGRGGIGALGGASFVSENREYPDASASSTAAVASTVGAGHAERRLLETTFGFNAAFCVFDCSRLSSLEGISHVFSFDLAMPPWVVAHTVRLFNQSKTTFVFVSFHGDLISSFGMHAILATRLSMRMGTSAESHVGFIYQKVPETEAQQRHQQQRELSSTQQHAVTPLVADSANAAGECNGEDSMQMQKKQLQWQLALLQGKLQELQAQQQQRRRHPSKLQRQRQELLRALEATKQETLQMLQLMLQHQQQGLLLQQQLQLVALLQQQHGECMVTEAKLVEDAARLLEHQHLQEHDELVQQLSLQYWAENKRQQTLLKEATAAVAVEQFSAAGVGRSSALDSKAQQVRRELRDKQRQLQNLELLEWREEQETRRLELRQRQSGLLLHQKSGLESRRCEGSRWLLETAQQHAKDVQQKQRLQLLLLKGIASSRTDRILHSIAAAGRIQQMAQIFVAAVSMLQHPVSRRKATTQQQQQHKMPCCCSGCCYPLYRGCSEQTETAATRVELMSAAHPQQQLLLLRRVFSAFQLDQLLERGSLMQEPQEQAIAAARTEALLVHFRDVNMVGFDRQRHTTGGGAASGKENAAVRMPYQCSCKQQNRCVQLNSSSNGGSSSCTVCIGGAAAALADLLPSIPYSRVHGVELQFCRHGQQQLQRKRLSRPIRRHGPSADSTAAASTTAIVTKLPAGSVPTQYDHRARSGGRVGCDTINSIVVVLPCLSPLCATCCYGDSLLLQLLRCSFPLAVQQQLLQQEVFMQQRMPLITVIDKQEQQQLEQQCMQDWKAAKAANLEPSGVPLAGDQTIFRGGMVECPLADAFDALQLLQQQLQQEQCQPTWMQHGPGSDAVFEMKYLEAAFRSHFDKFLEVQRYRVHLRRPLLSTEHARAPGAAVPPVVGHCDEDDDASCQKRTNFSAIASSSSCKQGCATASSQRQLKRPRRSQLSPALSETSCITGDEAQPAAREQPTAVAGTDFCSACCSEVENPVTISEGTELSEIELEPYEEQLLRICAVAAAKPSRCSCKRALQLLLQQRRLLERHHRDGDKIDYLSVGPPARDDSKWVSKMTSGRQLKCSATVSALSDSDCCSTHSSKCTCTSNSSRGMAGRRLALITVAGEKLQQVKGCLVKMQTALRQQLLLKVLQRDFPGHRVTTATAAAAASERVEKGALPVYSCSCSCAPHLHLEQQEVLFQGGKGSCMWWRQYYLLLGELAILKEKALYKAIDICLQPQEQSAPQEPTEAQKQLKQQQLQQPFGGQTKVTSVSVSKALTPDGEGPSILKGSSMGCRSSDPLLQSPLAPRKRKSQGGF